MADLTRIDAAQAVELTDGLSLTAALTASNTTGTEVGLVTREARIGQQTMANSIPVVVASDQSGTAYDEDSPHANGDRGAFILAVRNDGASTTFCTDNGDYSPISVDNRGRVYVIGDFGTVTVTPSGTQTVAINHTVTTTYSGTQTVAVSNATINNFEYAEDSTHTTGHVGSFILAVRNDTAATTFASANGDYSPISVDNVGRVFITGTVTAAIVQSVTIVPSGTQTVTGTVTVVPSGTQAVSIAQTVTTTYSGTQTVALSGGSITIGSDYAEDSIHTTGHVGSFMLAVRNDAVATTFASANGDYSPISVDNVGRVFVTGTVTSAIAQSVTIVPSGTQAVSIAQSVTIVPSGTQTVTGTVTNVPSGTQAVSIAQTVTTTYSGTQTVAINNTSITTASEYAEDSVHTSAHVGSFILAVRNDSASTTFASATGDYSPISVDNVGRVFVTGTVTSAIAQSVTIVPSGTQAVSIAQTVTTVYSGTQTVAITSAITSSSEYLEDTVHTSAHYGTFILAVRNDAVGTTFANANGDYSPISVDNVGQVFVTGTVTAVPTGTQTVAGTVATTIAQSVTIVPSGTQTVTGTVTSVIGQTVTTTYSGTQTVAISGSLTTADGYAEDSIHTSAHVGSFVLAVRNDSASTTFCSATGDYSPISVDNVGRVFVTGTVTSAIAQSVTIVPSGTQTVTGTVTSVPSGTQAVSIAQTVTTTYSGTQTVAISGSVANNSSYAEDSIHTTAHVGSFILAVRNDSAATTFCNADGDYSPISVDNVGRVFVTGTVTSAIAQSVTIVPSGTQTVTGTVTSVISQTVTTTYSGTQTVAITTGVSSASDYAEDSVHTTAHVGSFILAVRNDSAATTFCSATGDYSPISVDNVGRVFVTGTVTSAIAQSVTIVPSGTQAVSIAASVTIVPSGTQTVTGTVTTVAAAGASEYAEDSVHTTAHVGTFILGVRNSAATAFTSADGDYSPIAVDTSGRVLVTGIVQTEAFYSYAQDSTYNNEDVGAFVMAVRNDGATTTFCDANGDYSPISVDNVGRQFVTGTVTSVVAQSVTIVPSGTQAVSIAQSVTIVPSGTQTVTGTVTSVIGQTVTTTYSGTQTVAITTGVSSASDYAEDSVHTTAHVGSFVLAVRNDSASTTFCSATGDYSPISVDNVGRVFVTGTVTSAIAQSVTIVPSGTQAVSIAQSITIVPSGTQTVTGTVTSVIGQTVTTTYSGTQTVAINNTSITTASDYAEDSIHTSAHVGSFVLAVRNDTTSTTFCSATGDYSPISVDNVGRVFVTGTVTSAIAQSVTIVPSGTQTVTGTVTSVIGQTVTTTYSGTQTVAINNASITTASEYAEDSVHTTAHVGSFILAVRNDAVATTFASANGDYSPISVDNVGRVFVTGTVTSAIAQSVTIVPSGTQAVSITQTVTTTYSGTQTVAINNTSITTADNYAEDSVHTSAHVGSFVLAVRNDAVATTFTGANGDYSPISVDNVGRVFVTGTVTSAIAQSVTIVPSGTQTVTVTGTVTTSAGAGASEFTEDSIHTTGHTGTFVLAVRNDAVATTFTGANGDYSPISVDNVGRVFVTGTVTSVSSVFGQQTMANSIPVVVASDQSGSAYDEDEPHANGDRGAFILAVRNDGASTTFCTDNGDYSPISVDNRGRVYVIGDFGTVTVTPTGTQTVAINHTVTTTYSGTQTVAVSNATVNNFEYAEDSVHTTGHVGSFVLAVRNDAVATTFASANGDYSPISVDNVGRVFVTGSVTAIPSGTQTVTVTGTVTTSGGGGGTEYAEDSVHTTGHLGTQMLAVRNDAVATTFTNANGDYSPISVDNIGQVFVTGTVTAVPTGTQTVAGTVAATIAQSVTIVPSGTQTVTGTVTSVIGQTVTTTYSGTQTVAINNASITNASDYAEDSVHTSAHVGSFILAVRNDTASTTFASASGDYSPISVDNVGRVFVTGTVTSAIAQSVTIVPSGTQAVSIAQTVTTTYSGTQTIAVTGTVTTSGGGTEYAEDSIHTTGHLGTQMLAVRNDAVATTFTNANGDYSPISVDNVGRVFVTGTVTSTIAQSVTIVPSGTQTVTVTGTVTTSGGGTEYAEDSVHTSGHLGTQMLAVRNDAVATTFASANGDYSPVSVDNVGRVFVTGTVTSVSSVFGQQTMANSIPVVIASDQSGTGYTEDSPHANGDRGSFILAVRNDALATTFTNTDGDYSPISVDNVGRVYMTGTVTSVPSGTQTVTVTGTVTTSGGGGGTEYAEDSVHTTGHLGTQMLAVRNDSVATTFTGANGDYSPISVDNVGRVFVTGTVTSTIAQSVTIVPSGTQTVTGTVTSVIGQTVTTTYSGTQTVAINNTSITTADNYAEDSIHTSAHVGCFILAVRNDTASTTFTGANGDYSPISVDNVGRVFVTGTVTSVIAQSVTIVPSGTQTITGATEFAEDSVHTSAHAGTFVLAVRNDSASTTFCSANGDYSPFSVDNTGKVFVTGTVTAAVAQSVTIVPSGTQTVTGTVTSVASTGTRTITGDVANDASDSGNPVKMGGVALTANPTAVATGDRVQAMFDTLGKQVVLQGSMPDLYVDGRVELTTTTSTNVISAGGAGVRTMLTHVAISNANSAAVTVSILDGTTQKWTFYVAGGGGGAIIDLNVPFRGTVTTAWNAQVNTASWTAASGSGVYVTAAGYRAV